MRVVFRTDSSEQIGTGHVWRCLTLADYLTTQGDVCTFICRDLPGNIIKQIERRKHDVISLPPPPSNGKKYLSATEQWLEMKTGKDAGQTAAELGKIGDISWLVIDHYGIGIEWEQIINTKCGLDRIFVIDDLANREHKCDLLLDQNLNSDDDRYRDYLPDSCKVLLGPPYALLRPEFIETRQNISERTGDVERVLIFFGGVDADNATAKTMQAFLKFADNNIHLDVIVGTANPHYNSIREIARELPHCDIYKNVDDMAEFMAEADLAIGAGGTTAWERAWLGLPSLIIILAENQRAGTEALAKSGAAWNLGLINELSSDDIRASVDYASKSPEEMKKMSRAAMRIFGPGKKSGVEKVFSAMRSI
ncbi:MAG: UDP-2,4-diacetamido-2,4,6-trideoxy-beta-L-altropyranose hydrolase [candidate division Zixibacteria bacterium]|nr:UDP-2,4-diacetamido-2,4,6-trideoxy-beta-L-altropyranose hydrolase [candidate division Zixibacteria bacterium]